MRGWGAIHQVCHFVARLHHRHDPWMV
jgi:hypothetical protein